MRFCPPREGEERSPCSRLEDRVALLRSVVRTVVERVVEDEGELNEEARRALQRVKGHLWSEVNSMTNHGVLVGAAGRKAYKRKRSGWWRVQGSSDAPAESP